MIIRYPCEVIALDLLKLQHKPRKAPVHDRIAFNALY